jgi:hypothetical protein
MAQSANKTSRARALPIIFIGGGKGGTGKSVVAIALIDHALREGHRVLLVETDTTNPDVGKIYKDDDRVEIHYLDLGTHEGWLKLIDICDGNSNSYVIVNPKGGNAEDIRLFGTQMNDALAEIGVDRIATWWVINLYRDAVVALREFRSTIKNMPVHVIKNGCWGAEGDFDVYNQSGEREAIEKAGGQTVVFPQVANRILRGFFNDRASLDVQSACATLGTRAEIDSWRRKTSSIFDKLLGTMP